MENASKALLIAAAVLIMIILFSVMNVVFRGMAASTTELYSELEESEITQFNQKFFNYDGKTDLTIHDVVTIINIAKDNNTSGALPITVIVNVSWISTPSSITASDITNASTTELNNLLKEKLASSTTYKYTCNIVYATKSKLVGTVNISEVNS